MSYSFLNYPNPTAISPYKPGYQDYFNNQQFGSGSVMSYGLKSYTGRGNLNFSVNSMLPVTTAVVDKFETPLQFTRDMYKQVASYLLNSRLDFAQGLPYNLYVANGGNLYQLGSQQFNLLNPALLQQTGYTNGYNPYGGSNPYGTLFG